MDNGKDRIPGPDGPTEEDGHGLPEPLVEGAGRTEVRLEVQAVGRDLLLKITGGEAHVGAVAVCEPPGPGADPVPVVTVVPGTRRGRSRKAVRSGWRRPRVERCAPWRGSIRMTPRARRSRPSWPMSTAPARVWSRPCGKSRGTEGPGFRIPGSRSSTTRDDFHPIPCGRHGRPARPPRRRTSLRRGPGRCSWRRSGRGG